MPQKKASRLNEALLEMFEDLCVGAIKKETVAKITMRILGDKAPAKPAPLDAEEIRALREQAYMGQAVFASPNLNVTEAAMGGTLL
jgi:DNA-binding transcriptional regulator YiaG